MSGCSSSSSCVSGYFSRKCLQFGGRGCFVSLLMIQFPVLTRGARAAPGDGGLGAVALEDFVEFARFGGLGRLDLDS